MSIILFNDIVYVLDDLAKVDFSYH